MEPSKKEVNWGETVTQLAVAYQGLMKMFDGKSSTGTSETSTGTASSSDEITNPLTKGLATGLTTTIEELHNIIKKKPISELRAEVKDKYFMRTTMMRRLYRDAYSSKTSTEKTDEDRVSSTLMKIFGEGVCDPEHGKPILMKYYETVFLPSYGLTREQVLAGDVTIAKMRDILGTTKENSNDIEEVEFFDSSDFLDWEKDRPLYERYFEITHQVYSRFSQMRFTKENLRFILCTLDRYSEYLALGYSEEEQEAILTTLLSLLERRPATIKEVKTIFAPLFARYTHNSTSNDFLASLTQLFEGTKGELSEEYWRSLTVMMQR